MHKYTHQSRSLCWKAIHAIEQGDLPTLASTQYILCMIYTVYNTYSTHYIIYVCSATMTAAQLLFDRCAMPNCPSQLTSPKLHSILNNECMKAICLAMKGVGSQGDGSVQILCADEAAQEKVLSLLTELGCEGFKLTIPASAPTLTGDRLVLSPYRIKTAVLVVDSATVIATTSGSGDHIDSSVSVPASQPVPESISSYTPPSSQSISHILVLCEELISNDIESISLIVGDGHQPERSDSVTTATTTKTKEAEDQLAELLSPLPPVHEHNGQNYDLLHQKRITRALSKLNLIRHSDIKPSSTTNGHNSDPFSDDVYTLLLRAETVFTHTNNSSDNKPATDHGIHAILTSIRHRRSVASLTPHIGDEQTDLSLPIYAHTATSAVPLHSTSTTSSIYSNALVLSQTTDDGGALYFGGAVALPSSMISLYDFTDGLTIFHGTANHSISTSNDNVHGSSIPVNSSSSSSSATPSMHPLDAYLSRLRLIQHPSPEATPVYTGTGSSTTRKASRIVYI